MTEQSRSEVIVVDPSEVAAARSLAAELDVEFEALPQVGVEPVSTVTLILTGAALAVGALLQKLEQRKGGQVIDLRSGAPKAVYRTPELVYGLIVVITADGRVTVEAKGPEGSFAKVISSLPRLLPGGTTAATAARIVSEQFGSDVGVGPEPCTPPEL